MIKSVVENMKLNKQGRLKKRGGRRRMITSDGRVRFVRPDAQKGMGEFVEVSPYFEKV